MLVLTRSVGERLIINEGEIKLNVLEIKGNQVRIGIDAPRNISVHREEIFERIKSESDSKPKPKTSKSETKETKIPEEAEVV